MLLQVRAFIHTTSSKTAVGCVAVHFGESKFFPFRRPFTDSTSIVYKNIPWLELGQ